MKNNENLSIKTLSLVDNHVISTFTTGKSIVVRQNSVFLRNLRRPKIVLRIKKNLEDCGNWIKSKCSQCGWESEKEIDPHNIHISCGIRICNKDHCVNLRYKNTRKRMKKYLKMILNPQLIVLTFEYTKIEINTKEDIEKKFWHEVKKFVTKLERYYKADKFIVNIDIIKKPKRKYHIHFNVYFDCMGYIDVKFIRTFWKNRFKLTRADTKKKRKAMEDYLIKRIVQVNPRSKTGKHIEIIPEEYYDLFYKSRFFRTYLWNDVKMVILVDSGNIYIRENSFCPECGHRLLPKTLLMGEDYG